MLNNVVDMSYQRLCAKAGDEAGTSPWPATRTDAISISISISININISTSISISINTSYEY